MIPNNTYVLIGGTVYNFYKPKLVVYTDMIAISKTESISKNK